MKRLRGENGVEMLEFALVIPIFVFVLYGLIAYGVMLNAKQTITNAASEGARSAVGAQPATAQGQKDAAKARVDSLMKNFSQYNVNDPSQFDAQVGDCSSTSPGGPQCITVKITYPYSDKPLVPSAPGLGLITPDKLTGTAVVQVTS
jgi:Flp pilus assembly protein TadG